MKYCLNNVIFSGCIIECSIREYRSIFFEKGEVFHRFATELLYSLNSLLVSLYMVCPGTVVFHQCWQRQSWSISQWVLASTGPAVEKLIAINITAPSL